MEINVDPQWHKRTIDPKFNFTISIATFDTRYYFFINDITDEIEKFVDPSDYQFSHIFDSSLVYDFHFVDIGWIAIAKLQESPLVPLIRRITQKPQ